jgi:hypothetical protein
MFDVIKTLLLVSFGNRIFCFDGDGEFLERDRRFIVFPPTSPTRHQVSGIWRDFCNLLVNLALFQLISGIGIPVSSDTESVTLGWVIKAQYFLPETVTKLHLKFPAKN